MCVYGRSFISVKKDRETSYIDIRREMESLKLFEKQPQTRKFFWLSIIRMGWSGWLRIRRACLRTGIFSSCIYIPEKYFWLISFNSTNTWSPSFYRYSWTWSKPYLTLTFSSKMVSFFSWSLALSLEDKN